ncbi:uncharacterized protein LOC131934583 [Physella acuta]|uniref:uncharacterized protein LOC131934583 n=1 Tax=Physella acuta TaxID=109671 RepID=UPI0027DB8F30|nr:uncharacterized protein LOC131934583 [Physella acuta]
MASLISMIISRTSRMDNLTSHKELAIINVFNQNGHPVDISNENITISGKLDNTGVSYLNLVWENPDASKAGDYRCEANGVDVMGHPVIHTNNTSVTSIIPDDGYMVSQVFDLTDKLNQINSQVEHLVRINNIRDEKLELIKRTIFNISSSFNGRRYFLSPILNAIIDKHALAMCQLYNGYLAEIDSSTEYQFIVDFVFTDPRMNSVLIGATDETQEGVWVNRHTQTPANYTKWAYDYPTVSREDNCLYIWSHDAEMVDGKCQAVSEGYKFFVGYLCEVPD